MKVLITHNDYGRYSGEEAAVDAMNDMLTKHGHQVSFYRTTTAGHVGLASKIRMFLAGIYSIRGVRGMKKALKKELPDIVNIHNLYPFITPAALFVCKAAGVPVVMTVHNYRLICPTGLFLRDGAPCEHCLNAGNEWGCVRFNCEGKISKSIGYALRGFVARKIGAYQKNVDRYVCLTAFQKKKLIEAGFKADKITVISNKAPFGVGDAGDGSDTGLATRPTHVDGSAKPPVEHHNGAVPAETSAGETSCGDYIAYVGRLSEEKGWDMLVEIAARNPHLRIEVAGFVNEEVLGKALPDNIRFSGYLDQARLRQFYRKARFLVIPSRCYEGFPLVALEAMAMGKPVIGPDHGGFTEIIGRGPDAIGCLFQPGDPLDLEKTILSLWNDEQRIRLFGKKSIEKIKTAYSSEIIYRQWEHLFSELLDIGKN